MTTDGPAGGAVHHAMAEAATRLVLLGVKDIELELSIVNRVSRDDATGDDWSIYDLTVGGGWLFLAIAAVVTMPVTAGAGWLIGGRPGEGYALAVSSAVLGLGAAGSLYGAWRLHYARRALRMERRGRTDRPRYRRSLARARPRDTSLIMQAIVGVLAAVIELSAW